MAAAMTLTILLGLSLAACSPVAGPQAIDLGTGHDYIFSAELRHNGGWAMWIRNDDVGIYCLPTEELYRQADAIANSNDTEIVWHYKSLNQGLISSEYPKCNYLESGSITVTTYVVLDITSARDLPDPPSKKGAK
jgi:hypothetical protein